MGWQTMESAPKTGESIIVLTADGYAIEAQWDADCLDFYKSQKGWDSYDPANALGTWITYAVAMIGDDMRLYCGQSPKYWMPKEPEPQDNT